MKTDEQCLPANAKAGDPGPYRVLSARSGARLEAHVCDSMTAGFVPCGGIAVHVNSGGEWFLQAMYRPAEGGAR